MRKNEQDYDHLASLYRLAWLLTGCSENSVDLVINAFELLDDSYNLRSAFIQAELRRSVIRTALTVNDAGEPGSSGSRPVPASHGPDLTWEQLEAALFQLDLFSRRTLVLTVFEGYTLQDAACLLARDVQAIAEVRATALCALARSLNLAHDDVGPSLERVNALPL